MAKSITEARKRLDYRYRGVAYTNGSNVYIALHTADPTRADLANELTPGSGGYARAVVAISSGAWTAATTSGGEEIVTNTGALSFGTASSNLGTVTHFSVRTAATGGDMLDFGALGVSKTISNGDPITAPAGALIIADA